LYVPAVSTCLRVSKSIITIILYLAFNPQNQYGNIGSIVIGKNYQKVDSAAG
jgi:hypothetical protein